MTNDIWTDEHFPVLREAVTRLDQEGTELGGPSSGDISKALGLGPARVVSALERLAEGGFIEIRVGTGSTRGWWALPGLGRSE